MSPWNSVFDFVVSCRPARAPWPLVKQTNQVEKRIMNSMERPRLTILLPVRNEEMNLRVMLRIIKTVLEYPHEVLVIHDMLYDRSIPIVREVQATYPGLRLV